MDWTRIAVDCGYFDQAHFIHDFRAFAGITPTGYRDGPHASSKTTSNFYNPEPVRCETIGA